MNRQIPPRFNYRSLILTCGIMISAISFILLHNHSSFGDLDPGITSNAVDYPSEVQTIDFANASNPNSLKMDASKKELKDAQVHFNFLTSFLEVESNSSKNEPKENDARTRGLIARLGSIYNIFSAK